MPLGLCSRALLPDDVAEIEVVLVVEIVMDWVMDKGEFMQDLYVPEIRHRPSRDRNGWNEFSAPLLSQRP